MLEKSQPDGLPIEDLLRLQWLLGTGLVLIACWALWPLPFSGAGLVLVLGLTVVAVMLRPQFCYWLSPRWVRIASPFVLIIVGADLFLSAPDFLPAVLRMLLLLLFFRAAAMRSGREDLQLLLLCLFALVLSGVITASLAFAGQILLFTLLSLPLLFLRAQTELADELAVLRRSIWRDFSWGRFSGRVWRQLNWQLLGFSLVAFVGLTVISSLLFLLIPRFQLERTIQLFQLNTSPRSGFSESIALGYITQITLDNSVALRIDGPGRDAFPATPYWRMLVLDEYHRGRFSMSSDMRFSNDERMRRRYVGPIVRVESALHWQAEAERSGPWVFYMEGHTSRFLPLPGPFDELRFTQPEDVFYYSLLHNLSNRTVRSGVFSYRMEHLQWADAFPADALEAEALARLVETGPISLRFGDQAALEEDKRYPMTTLLLPLTIAEREQLQAVLAEIFASDESVAKSDPSAFSARLEQWLGHRFSYSLSPDIPQQRGRGDPVVAWLSEGSMGHCELFAGAFLLLAREAGHPTRIVTGFAGGAWNSVENYFVVRNRHAHAWVEIYDASAQQWLPVDPTPARFEDALASGVLGEGDLSAIESGWAAWLDSLRILWYRRIVNFDHDEQMRLAESLLETLSHWQQSVRETISEGWQALSTHARERFGSAVALGLALCGVALLIGLGAIFYCVWPWLRFSVNRKPTLHPWRLRAGRLLRALRQRRSQRDASSAAMDATLAEQVQNAEQALEAIRFGPLPSSAKGIKNTFGEARRLQRALRKS